MLGGLRSVLHPLDPPPHGRVLGQAMFFSGEAARGVLARVEGSASRAAISDSLGVFVIDSVPAGPQTVRIQLVGYQAQDHRLIVTRGGTETICAVLQLLS
jgi:hypothetical protein